MSMKRLLLIALALALLLALASARPAAATYDGQASATMSCTDNTATMTRTVIVTITWGFQAGDQPAGKLGAAKWTAGQTAHPHLRDSKKGGKRRQTKEVEGLRRDESQPPAGSCRFGPG